MPGRREDELLEIVRVLLLLQGAILVATTIEAAVWSAAFRSGATPLVLSAVAAVALLAARARLHGRARRARRVVFVVEGVILATLIIDSVLAIAIRGSVPPPVAMLTRLVIPLAVVVLLRRSAREVTPAAAPAGRGA